MNLHLVISWCLSMLRKMFIFWISSNIFSCHTKKVICKDCKRKLDFCKMWQEKFLGCTCFHYFHSLNSCLNETHQLRMRFLQFWQSNIFSTDGSIFLHFIQLYEFYMLRQVKPFLWVEKYRKKRILFILLDCMIMCIQTLFCIFSSLNGFRLVQSDLLEMSHKMGIVKQGVVSCWAKFYVYSVLAIEISLINLSTSAFNTYLK